MSLWMSLKRLLDPSANLLNDTFSMGNRGDQPAAEQNGPKRLADTQVRAEGVLQHIDNLLEASPKGTEALKKTGDLSAELDQNLDRLKAIFRVPTNKDLVLRELQIATQPPVRAVVCFMEGLSDKAIQNEHILQPLMLLSHLDHHVDGEGEHGRTRFSLDAVIKRLLPSNQVSEKYSMADIAQALLAGDTVLLFEGERTALAMETKGPPVRSVGEPKTERVILGPYDAFTESFRLNVAMVRRRLKDPRVVTDIVSVGEISNAFVAIMYIDGIAAPKLAAEVKRRIESVKVDLITSTGMLEQFIEDSPRSLMPGVLTTERPDRVAAYLSEGHVAVFVDTSPFAMICPVTFWSLLQTSEDYYLRHPFGPFLRYLRLFAFLIALIAPAIYIAVINYHQEMLPTQLMLFIATTREHVPMPAVVELIVMDLSFELIREAGTRIPSTIGPTIGLVASLVLGQAAVEAKLVSPLMILVVAMTGLASFAVPNYLTAFGVRSVRFLLLALAMVLGFYGLATGAFLLIVYLAGMRSFGVPYLAPVAPGKSPAAEGLARPMLFDMEMRPSYVRPLDKRRQAEVVRPWDPMNKERPSKESESEGDER